MSIPAHLKLYNVYLISSIFLKKKIFRTLFYVKLHKLKWPRPRPSGHGVTEFESSQHEDTRTLIWEILPLRLLGLRKNFKDFSQIFQSKTQPGHDQEMKKYESTLHEDACNLIWQWVPCSSYKDLKDFFSHNYIHVPT